MIGGRNGKEALNILKAVKIPQKKVRQQSNNQRKKEKQ
jgi:hypothetical protein